MSLTSDQALNSNFNKANILHCNYCSKECKNLNSLKQHECRCKENPNRIVVLREGFNEKGRRAWNKGLTAETDIRLADRKVTYAKNHSAGLHLNFGRKHTAHEKELLRKAALKNKFGGFHMRRGIFYNGIKLDSSYEVILAEDLDLNNIKWVRPKRFPYHINGRLHYYTPDFYLPDYNVYLDPKNDFLINNVNPNLGYKDVDKIKQVEIENNIIILILSRDQLNWSSIKTML